MTGATGDGCNIYVYMTCHKYDGDDPGTCDVDGDDPVTDTTVDGDDG